MLLMFKALKRKPKAKTATTTQSDTSMSSISQSKQKSAVNCMDLSLNLTSVSVLQMNLPDEITAIKLVTQQSPTNSNDFANLRFLYNDINSLHNTNDHEHPFISNVTTQIDKYANKQSFYEIESNNTQMASPQQMPATITQSIQSNNSVVNINKLSNKKQKKLMKNGDEASSHVLSEAAIECGKKSGFKKRLKFKLKAGFGKDTKVRCHIAFSK